MRRPRFFVPRFVPRCLGFGLLVVGLPSSLVACGGQVGHDTPDAGYPDPVDPNPARVDAGTPPADAAATTPLSPTFDGGGLALSCTPSPGGPTTGSMVPSCTYVDEPACKTNQDCGCGCQCQCGVCNCNQSGSGSSCATGASAAAAAWVGTFVGTMSWPTTLYSGQCATGLTAAGGSGVTGGPMTVTVTASGDALSFALVSEQGSGQQLCSLPFTASGDDATLVAGAACVTYGLANGCTLSGPPSIGLQTFYAGSATLNGDTLTLSTKDVFTEPSEPGPECGSVPAGLSQVNVESLSATLTRTRAADGG